MANEIGIKLLLSSKDQTPSGSQPRQSRTGRRRWLALALTAILTGMAWAAPFAQISVGQQPEAGEYELKAVYLFNFLHFVYWPDKPDQSGHRVIGVIGSAPLYEALLQLKARLEEAGREEIAIINLGPYQSGMDLPRCDLLFISSSEQNNFAMITATLKNTPVLTVSETDDFLSTGGMIALVTLDNKLRWAINRPPVQSAGLRLTAKLLDMAVRVVPTP